MRLNGGRDVPGLAAEGIPPRCGHNPTQRVGGGPRDLGSLVKLPESDPVCGLPLGESARPVTMHDRSCGAGLENSKFFVKVGGASLPSGVLSRMIYSRSGITYVMTLLR